METKNARRERHTERVRERRLADERAEGARRAHLDRVARREQAAGLRSRVYTPQEWASQLARVSRVLEAVNRHRAAQDPVRLDEIHLPERATPGP